MVSVRRLGVGDLAGYRAMNAVFCDVFGEPEHYSDNKPDDGYCEDWLASPNSVAIIAEEGEQTVGALAGYILPKFEQTRSEGYIYDLAVAETHRRIGIATAMIAEMRRVAREAGAWTVFVQADVLPEDGPARALYRKLAHEEIMAHHFDIQP
ncbi:GNAT family N-acetyltransferase [Altererythrobacter sp. GH1-8]|uniref:GNAT family N-acetyltransferase n=1 Tax=Altererythrobacter sp. GH1-8 TaxID=3349333 RepID=UPI00374D9C72